MSIQLEICVDSIESAIAARQGGADRLEVCSALAVGGTTPSLGLARRCVTEIQLPVMMMIRPHDGGFVYRDDDLEVMLADIEAAKTIGVHGVVFAALTKEREVHLEHCQRLLEAADSLATTFHRAFDLVADPMRSLDQIIELGFDRLLTSGQAATAEEGAGLIGQLCDRAEHRIELVAGGGVNPQNARRVAATTGVRELHASGSVPRHDSQAKGSIAFGTHRRVTSAELVHAIRQALE